MASPLLYLDRNENLYGPAPKCLEALRRISSDQLTLYSRDYARGVKSRLSERLASELAVLEPQILLGEGSEDLLKQAIHCYLGPGEAILCPEQSWWYYRSVATEVKGKTITFSLKESSDRFAYDVDEILSAGQRLQPRIVLIASPNNPTGNSLSDVDLHRLTEAFRESIVILDEAYWGFSAQSNDRIAGLIRTNRNLLILRTFSKFYALAGARIGFAAAGSGLSRLSGFASRYLGYNRISEELALAALDSPDYYIAMSRAIREDRERYYALFDSLQGFRCYRSDANFLLVRIPTGHREELEEHFKKEKLIVRFFQDSTLSDFMRITLGTREHNARLIASVSAFAVSRRIPAFAR